MRPSRRHSQPHRQRHGGLAGGEERQELSVVCMAGSRVSTTRHFLAYRTTRGRTRVEQPTSLSKRCILATSVQPRNLARSSTALRAGKLVPLSNVFVNTATPGKFTPQCSVPSKAHTHIQESTACVTLLRVHSHTSTCSFTTESLA
jgi:hypothetical protein